MCYVWHEAVGGVESDVFASIFTHFFTKGDRKKTLKKLRFGVMNADIKTVFKLSNVLLEMSIKTNIIIDQKYLEVGHTFMEVRFLSKIRVWRNI